MKRRWIGAHGTVIALPFPLLHPWRKRLVGALLGLCGDELTTVIRQHDCSPLFEPTRAALREPSRNLETRIDRCSDGVEQVALAAELAALEQAVSRGLRLDDLWLSELEVLSPRLLLDGYRSGAPDLLASPLTRSYRRIEGLAHVEAGANATMRRAVWVELQRSIDDLFGETDGAPRPGTLADLLRRIWPSTTPSRLRVSVPGLFEHCSARDLRGSPAAQVLASSLPSTDATWELGLLTADGVLPLPTDTADATWQQRAAWRRCTGPRLVHLAALCLGIDARPSVVAALGSLPGAAVLQGEPQIGPIVLRELLKRLRPPHGCPSALLEVLEPSEPRTLPSDRAEAIAKLEQRLELAVPGSQLGAVLVRGALARVLGGFWRGKPTVEQPRRWVWSLHADDAPARFRRTVPRPSSRAWRSWPGYDLMVNPAAAALQGWATDTSGAYGLWFGLGAPDLIPADELDAPTLEDEPASAHNPVPPVAPPLEPEIRVLAISLGEWFHQHIARSDHVDR